jgi:hypothetical protein
VHGHYRPAAASLHTLSSYAEGRPLAWPALPARTAVTLAARPVPQRYSSCAPAACPPPAAGHPTAADEDDGHSAPTGGDQTTTCPPGTGRYRSAYRARSHRILPCARVVPCAPDEAWITSHDATETHCSRPSLCNRTTIMSSVPVTARRPNRRSSIENSPHDVGLLAAAAHPKPPRARQQRLTRPLRMPHRRPPADLVLRHTHHRRRLPARHPLIIRPGNQTFTQPRLTQAVHTSHHLRTFLLRQHQQQEVGHRPRALRRGRTREGPAGGHRPFRSRHHLASRPSRRQRVTHRPGVRGSATHVWPQSSQDRTVPGASRSFTKTSYGPRVPSLRTSNQMP